jgi:hypothetical protein
MTPLRTTLFSTALSLSLGCSFFSIPDADKVIPKKPSGSAGKTAAAGMTGAAGTETGVGGTSGGMGGSASGSGGTGTGGSAEGATGGSSGSGTGGDATMAGSGGSAGSATMAGAGGASGGMPALGGMGGDNVVAGGGGMVGAGGSIDPGACASISSDAKAFGGHCYVLVTNAVNFNTAKMDCVMKQSHLVTISNGDPASKDTFDAEDMFVYGLAGGKDTWLGLADGKMDRDPGDGTPYVWIDGEPNPPADWGMAYGWQSGEPNNYQKPCMNGDTCYEHCGMMVADAGDKWNDDLCEATKQYVCEWDSLPSAPAQ